MKPAPSVQDLLLEQLAEPKATTPAVPLTLVPRITKVKPAMNLPLLTLLSFTDLNYSTALCEAINRTEKRLYIEDFHGPYYDAVEAMVGAHQFDSIRNKPEWQEPLWKDGFKPAEIYLRLCEELPDELPARLLVTRVRELTEFASYRFVVRDAKGIDIAPLFKAFPAEEILIVADQAGQPLPKGARFIPLPFDSDTDPDGSKGCALILAAVGTL